MLLACYSHKHISYRIRTIIRKAILASANCNVRTTVGAKFYKHHVALNLEYPLLSIQW
ncbi:hypothetical protein [Wolbachia endosymbiont (group A) of Scambus nigricans]|uniref:hypothetical protein n=1 Tax=Wolbachia endosymbiont (group A) of Scambus nigricans TaxID=2954055 RepID=UPI00222F3FA9|nr:hypothetical protein [Wolbachia endosymbiont (group A) of Scambus nigricans]